MLSNLMYTKAVFFVRINLFCERIETRVFSKQRKDDAKPVYLEFACLTVAVRNWIQLNTLCRNNILRFIRREIYLRPLFHTISTWIRQVLLFNDVYFENKYSESIFGGGWIDPVYLNTFYSSSIYRSICSCIGEVYTL